jgi:hypothetical protein
MSIPKIIIFFMENLYQTLFRKHNLARGYKAMSFETLYEREALEWCEALIGDIAE